jgi:hypothetical protein
MVLSEVYGLTRQIAFRSESHDAVYRRTTRIFWLFYVWFITCPVSPMQTLIGLLGSNNLCNCTYIDSFSKNRRWLAPFLVLSWERVRNCTGCRPKPFGREQEETSIALGLPSISYCIDLAIDTCRAVCRIKKRGIFLLGLSSGLLTFWTQPHLTYSVAMYE